MWQNRISCIILRVIFNTCQKKKRKNFKYGKLHAKEVEVILWEILLVDLMVPYKSIIEVNDNPLILKSWTMIDSETRWFEIVQYNYKQSSMIANLVGQTWFCRYPCSTIMMYNRGNEFLGNGFKKDLIET